MQFLLSAESIKKNFTLELRDAAAGKQTSLRFIKHQLPKQKIVQDNELFQVLVIGGSVFQKALLKKEDGQFFIINSQREEHPLLKTKTMFLEYLAKHLYADTDIIALNFAYPLLPHLRNNRIDSVLLSGGKKDQLQGLVGQRIGETVERYIKNIQHRNIVVSVANDVICLLLSGLDSYPPESLAGAVMGTGTNLSFFYNSYAINIQSGGFNKFTPSAECLEIDRNSLRPGHSLFEKEVAGLYLYQHFNLLIKKQGLSYPPIISTKELMRLTSSNPIDHTPTLSLQEREIKEKERLRQIARFLMEKSAAYMAGQIAGLAAFKQSDISLIMEGSMYWENPLYRQFVNDYLQKLSPDHKISIVKIENSPIIGGARLIG